MNQRHLHAYRVIAQFAADWRALRQARRDFVERYVRPFDEAHPNNKIAWTGHPFSLDPAPVGFGDGKRDEPPPRGLSRNKERSWLIPKRGGPGREWEMTLEQARKMPSIDKLLADYSIPAYVWSGDRVYRTKIETLDQSVWVTNLAPLESPSLRPARLSEYYAAREALSDDGDKPAQ